MEETHAICFHKEKMLNSLRGLHAKADTRDSDHVGQKYFLNSGSWVLSWQTPNIGLLLRKRTINKLLCPSIVFKALCEAEKTYLIPCYLANTDFFFSPSAFIELKLRSVVFFFLTFLLLLCQHVPS